MRKPNFFIVGAPKCGTTAMNDYLAQHPAVFMAAKELHYFGTDLKVASRLSTPEYIKHFKGAQHQTVVGEASVWYLFSEKAAAEIRAFSPDARIVIMLRNPVEVLHSLHSQHLYDGNEVVRDFGTAVSLDDERKKGNQLPRSVDFTHLPPYIDSVLFSEQVKRYLDVFGRDRVHIILYDDFTTGTKKVVMDTFRFLGVAANVHIDYKVVNSNKQIRIFKLHRLLKNPSALAKKVVRILLPFKTVRHAIMRYLFSENITTKKRPEMNPAFKMKLKSQVTDDIIALEKLIGRDLSGWLQ